MKRYISFLTLTALLSASMAQAEERCAVAMTDWQPREAVVRIAADNGWTVRRIKIDDGCYEVTGTDAAGKKLDVKLHPATLEILVRSYKENEHGEHDEHKDK